MKLEILQKCLVQMVTLQFTKKFYSKMSVLLQNSIGAGAPRLPLVDVADDNEKDETITTFCMAPTNPNQKGRLVFEKNYYIF